MTQDICIFGSELAPSSDGVYVGGSATSAIRLARSLSEMGKRVHIVTMAPRDWDDKRIHEYQGPDWASSYVFNATAQHPSVLDGLDLLYTGTKELMNYCKENNIEVIHSHSGYSSLAIISIITGRFVDLPVIHTQYCPIPTKPRNIEELLSSPLPARFVLNRADHVFSMTHNIKESLQSNGVTNTTFMPPVIDIDKYRPDLSPPHSVEIADDKLTLLFVGNLKPDKGVEYLVKAVGKAKSTGLPLQLILTTERDFPGSERRRDQLNRLIDEYGLQENVVELGIINDMPNVIAHSDVLVAPFTTTSGPSDYPLVVLEAMACETPVIASDIGGISELVSDGRGYLVPPRDHTAIERAIRNVLDGEDMNNPRQFITERFAPEPVAQSVSDVYEKYDRN